MAHDIEKSEDGTDEQAEVESKEGRHQIGEYEQRPSFVRAVCFSGANVNAVRELLGIDEVVFGYREAVGDGKVQPLYIEFEHHGIKRHVAVGWWVVLTDGGGCEVRDDESFRRRFMAKRPRQDVEELKKELDLCKRDAAKADRLDMRLATMQATLLKLQRQIGESLASDGEDGPRFSEGQLENAAWLISRCEQTSEYFLKATAVPESQGVNVLCRDVPSNEWMTKLRASAHPIPVTFGVVGEEAEKAQVKPRP